MRAASSPTRPQPAPISNIRTWRLSTMDGSLTSAVEPAARRGGVEWRVDGFAINHRDKTTADGHMTSTKYKEHDRKHECLSVLLGRKKASVEKQKPSDRSSTCRHTYRNQHLLVPTVSWYKLGESTHFPPHALILKKSHRWYCHCRRRRP